MSIKKAITHVIAFFVADEQREMVPVGGLEPPRLAATDFESVVYTNFTTLA
jgi:hypothetical protein